MLSAESACNGWAPAVIENRPSESSAKKAPARDVAEYAVQRWLVRPRKLGQLCDMPRSILHQIGDAELCHDKHGLAELSILPDQASKKLCPICALLPVHDIAPKRLDFPDSVSLPA